MAGYRSERIAELIHRELAVRLRRDIKDPDLTAVSITRVTVTRDLRRANIAYMPLGGGGISDSMADAVERAARSLRGPIGRALRLRHAPELVFHPDEHTEAAFRVMRLLDEVEPMADESEENE